MGLLSRMSTVFKAKVNSLLDAAEDPRETLEYSAEKQRELLTKVERGLADVVTSKKELEIQLSRLQNDIAHREEEARQALQANREDLARAALAEKAQLVGRQKDLEAQIQEISQEEEKMSQAARRLREKITGFEAKKELIKAQYSTAEAQVRIGEAATGISEELADAGYTLERAQAKTDKLRARAQAIDELGERGDLPEPGVDATQAELDKLAEEKSVEEDLARLKGEIQGGAQG